jgi:hypothetical protein
MNSPATNRDESFSSYSPKSAPPALDTDHVAMRLDASQFALPLFDSPRGRCNRPSSSPHAPQTDRRPFFFRSPRRFTIPCTCFAVKHLSSAKATYSHEAKCYWSKVWIAAHERLVDGAKEPPAMFCDLDLGDQISSRAVLRWGSNICEDQLALRDLGSE